MNAQLQDQAKLRKAETINPPNKLKEKVGSGGLNESVLAKAQTSMEKNAVEFLPIAQPYIDMIDKAIDDVRKSALTGEKAIEAVIYPAMQLKAQGTMFQYPAITDIGDVLVNFLEVVPGVDKDVLDIIVAHRKAMRTVLVAKMKGDTGTIGKELKGALIDACNRYYAKQERLKKK